MWIYDDGGALIKGGCDVADREFSIEFKGFHHNLSIPTDNATGKPTGTRQHSPMIIVKEFDYSSPYLYKAVATGQNLKSAEIKWYKISDAGQEVEYFNMLLEGVRIVSISPTMASQKTRTTTILNLSNLDMRRSLETLWRKYNFHRCTEWKTNSIIDEQMDTTEELNGTYFYHGQSNLSAGELFDVIFLEQFCDELGIGIESGAAILAGQPWLKTRTKPERQ